MNISECKPSHIIRFPNNSVTQAWEKEFVAGNIILTLQQNGDTFRELLWDEYFEFVKGQIKRVVSNRQVFMMKHTLDEEKQFFEEVKEYCTSAEKACMFSLLWADDLGKAVNV